MIFFLGLYQQRFSQDMEAHEDRQQSMLGAVIIMSVQWKHHNSTKFIFKSFEKKFQTFYISESVNEYLPRGNFNYFEFKGSPGTDHCSTTCLSEQSRLSVVLSVNMRTSSLREEDLVRPLSVCILRSWQLCLSLPVPDRQSGLSETLIPTLRRSRSEVTSVVLSHSADN